jgi:hypothetical protein
MAKSFTGEIMTGISTLRQSRIFLLLALCAVAVFWIVPENAPVQQNQPASLSHISESVADREYAITFDAQKGVYQSPNRQNNLRIEYMPLGFSLKPRKGDNNWLLSLQLQSISKGRGSSLQLHSSPAFNVFGNTLHAMSDDYTLEYINSPQGMRQNFIIHQPPQGNQPLRIELAAVSNQLKPEHKQADIIHFTDQEGITRAYYSGLKVWDASRRELHAEFQVEQNTIAMVVNDEQALYPITVDPLSSTPDWEREGDQANIQLGQALSSIGDINRDGIVDFALGVPLYDGGQTDEGAVFIYLGSPTGPTQSPARILESDQAGAQFGYSICAAGDLNRDGFADIAVGAPLFDNGETDEGRLYIYFGNTNNVNPTPAAIREINQANARFGHSISNAGRVDADDTNDIAISAPFYDNGENDEGAVFVYPGGSTGIRGNTTLWQAESNQADARMGWSIAGGADLNNDGRSDLAVGIPMFDNGQTNEGIIRVYYSNATGISTTAAWQVESNQASAELGYSLAIAGDVNGDGINDLAAGAPYFSAGEQSEGRAYVYLGSATGLAANPVWTGEANQANARFGQSVAGAGDVNGDGNADILIGSPLYDNGQQDEGRAFLYFGSTNGVSFTPGWTGEGDQDNAQYGISVAGLGDINNDGKADIAAGAPLHDGDLQDEGKVRIYYGLSTSLLNANRRLEMNVVSAQFGFSTASAGDVNGDGIDDLIIGAPFYTGDLNNEGRILVYLGTNTGISPVAAWTLRGGQAGAQLGYCVAGAGDVNGDGFADIIAGAPGYSNGQTAEGRVLIFLGSAQGISGTNPAWSFESNQAGAALGRSVSGAGDLNNDGFSDILIAAPDADSSAVDEGIAMAFAGSQTGLGNTPIWTGYGKQAGARFGYSIAAADANGDGYSDIIVGAPFYNTDADPATEGRIQVFYGRLGFPIAAASWTYSGTMDNARYGFSVAAAGDVNSDGIADIAAGAPGYSNGQQAEGRAEIFYGNTAGLPTTASWATESNRANALLGSSLAGRGDYDADGIADFITGAPGYSNGQVNEGSAYIYKGGSNGLSATANLIAESDQSGAIFGTSISFAGDINGDGISDIAIGAPLFDNGENDEGNVSIFNGQFRSPGDAPALQLTGSQPDEQFGWVVAGRADFNGDGYADLAVGSPYYDGQFNDEGRVLIYYGSTGGIQTAPSLSLSGARQNGANFGYVVSAAGDINGDGYSDLLVTSPYFDDLNTFQQDIGQAYIYYGSANGLTNTPGTVFTGQQVSGTLGYAAAIAGDMNSDGYSDIVLGEPGYVNSQGKVGRVHVLYGTEKGLNTANFWSHEGEQANAMYGTSVNGAGDVNGDGIADLLIGAYSYDRNIPQGDHGRVYLHYGTILGIADSAGWTSDGEQAKAYYGAQTASAGDVNGDGYADVLISAIWYDQGQSNEGLVSLFLGSAAGLRRTPSWTAEGNIETTEFGAAIASAGDINGDGFGDILIGNGLNSLNPLASRARLYYGNQNGLSTNPAWTYNTTSPDEAAGTFITPAADLNGDGYSDFIISTKQYETDITRRRGVISIFYGNGTNGARSNAAQFRPGTQTRIQVPLRVQSAGTADLGADYIGFYGRSKLRPHIEVKPLGQSFNGQNLVIAADWTDAAGISTLFQQVKGLSINTSYKWRIRFETRPSEGLPQRFSRWLNSTYNTPGETDFRTGAACNLTFGNAPDIRICQGTGRAIGSQITGGLAPYQYIWSPAEGLSATNTPTPLANPQRSTTYTVSVVDASGCIARDTIVVTVAPAITVQMGNDITICAGDSVRIPISISGGTPPFRYEWLPASSGLSSNTVADPWAQPAETTRYTVLITDAANCTARDTFVVNVNPRPFPPIIQLLNDSTLICGSTAAQYQWYKDNQKINGANQQTLRFTRREGSGIYRVEVIDGNNCRNISATFGVATSVEETRLTDGNIQVQPNPVTDKAILSIKPSIPVQDAVLELTSLLGEKIMQHAILPTADGSIQYTLDLSSMPQGMYIVKISSGIRSWTTQLIRR